MMGKAQNKLSARHTFPQNRIFWMLCALPFFIKVIAAIIKVIIRTKIAIKKNQNKRIVGVCSINDTYLRLIIFYHTNMKA